MTGVPARTRFAAFILFLGLLASLAVAFERARVERATQRVELAMDYNDFVSLARSYNYEPVAFLVALRRAGLTSLALTEELGANVGSGNNAVALSGAALLNQAHLTGVSDPSLAALVRSGRVRADEVYVLVFDDATFARYRASLPLHFERKGIRVLRSSRPYIVAVRTQLDYFNGIGLGIPQDQLDLAKRLDLLIIPRFQNDERLQKPQMDTMFDNLRAGKRLSTAIFFGLRNQVLGFPDHLPDAAAIFNERKALNFGEIETYDQSQVQKGNDALAKLIPGRTVRVQAIAKLELDKLSLPEIVARYELGVRERNVRVVYLRPFAHQYNGASIEATNVEMVRQIADDVRARGFRLGRAAPIPLYRGNSRILVGLSALAVPSMFVLLLGWYRGFRWSLAIAAYVVTLAIYAGGVVSHHDLLARSILALLGALLFATAAFVAFSGAFRSLPAALFWTQAGTSVRWTVVALGVALLGALVVVGLMSSPLTMEEVEPFRGVKLVLALPPLIALALYLSDVRFDSGIANLRDALASPIRIYQLLAAFIVLGAGALVLARSGNQSDIAPSQFELALRHHLTVLLSVRPRFKEFLVGFPFMMLVPALQPAHRRAVGIILALGIGVSIGDIIDTFSHLHTPLSVSILRVFNGLVIGIVVGLIAIAVYRWATRPATQSRSLG